MDQQLLSYMAIAGAMGLGVPSQFKPKHPEIDIEKEYELIKQKKSKLSANKRRWVERQYQLMQK